MMQVPFNDFDLDLFRPIFQSSPIGKHRSRGFEYGMGKLKAVQRRRKRNKIARKSRQINRRK